MEKKRILAFALGGEILDKGFGKDFQDAKGIIDVFKRSSSFNPVMTDYPGVYSPEEFNTIFIFPKNYNDFYNKDHPKFAKKYTSQLDFLDNIRSLSKNKRPKIYCLFNELNTSMLNNNFLDRKNLLRIDPFENIQFDAIYDYFCYCEEKHLARDAFINLDLQKHIDKEYILRWTLIAHLPYLIKQRDNYLGDYEQIDLFETELDHLPKHINRFYYGKYNQEKVNSLKKLGFGNSKNDLILGDENYKNVFELNTLNNGKQVPINILKKLIKKAKYNLLPFDEILKHQITNRQLELLVFNGKILIDDKNKNNLQLNLDLNNEQLIMQLTEIKNIAKNNLIDIVMQRNDYNEWDGWVV